MKELFQEWERKVWLESERQRSWRVVLTAEDIQDWCDFREIDLGADEDFAWQGEKKDMHIHFDAVPRKKFRSTSVTSSGVKERVSIGSTPKSQSVESSVLRGALALQEEEEAEKHVSSRKRCENLLQRINPGQATQRQRLRSLR